MSTSALESRDVIGIVLDVMGDECGLVDLVGNPVQVSPEQLDEHPLYGDITERKVAGQWMVRIPWFFYRCAPITGGPHAGRQAIWISPEPVEGFQVHPAFLQPDGEAMDFMVGKYPATEDGPLVGSQPPPAARVSCETRTMEARAAARGDGWMILNDVQSAAIALLVQIELTLPGSRTASDYRGICELPRDLCLAGSRVARC